jgi:hypothetical protein
MATDEAKGVRIDHPPEVENIGKKLRDFKHTRSGFKTSDQVQGQGAGRSKKRSIHEYVSILKRSATQLSGARWGFETTSN